MALILKQYGLHGLARQAVLGLSRLREVACYENLPEGSSIRSYGSQNPFEEKGRGEENIRFRKEDERLLRQLLNKVKKHADSVDVHEAESSKSIEMDALKDILGKYNVSDADLQKILEWKHA